MNVDNEHSGDESAEVSTQRRRDFIKLAGKVAVLTPPVMMGLAAPSAHATGKSALGNYDGYKPSRRKYRKIKQVRQIKRSKIKGFVAKIKYGLRSYFS